MYRYFITDVEGKEHEITALQAAAYRCDGVAVRAVRVD